MILNNYRQNYQWNFVGISVGNKKIITEGYTDEIKRINLFFITNGCTDEQKITDKRFTDGAFPSMIPSVINLPTEYVSYADGKIPSVKLLNLVVKCFSPIR